MELFKVLLILVTATLCRTENSAPVAVTRTELKVSRSLDPETTQTLKVMTRDGGVAQLIVKKRDPKSKVNGVQEGTGYRPVYSNWIPVTSVVWPSGGGEKKLQNDTSGDKPKVSNVIDSDIIPYVPRPVTIQSTDIFVKNTKDAKRGRSVSLGRDGIPVVHGVRVPDDETDKHQTWRNARVINGELYPYEKGYKPPAAIPIGELVYANKEAKQEEPAVEEGFGPFTKDDNFKGVGPFSVRDNLRRDYVRFDHTFGPFTKEDNYRFDSSKLIDYIKEINDKEAKRDYFTARRYRSVGPQMQRRMLQYPGHNSYPNSLVYTPTTKLSPVNVNEGVRTPVLQYAHPELGVQPAKIPSEEEIKDFSKYELKPNRNFDVDRAPNSVEYYKKDVLNYPYGSYYIKPKPEQPFWLRFTESLKDNVQNGLERMQQFTRPVFEPIVEASQKISYNLGLSKQEVAQKKVGFIAPAGSVILPALGLVAGGAALGLGAAAVGRFLEPNEMRALNYPEEYIVLNHRRYARSLKDNTIFSNKDNSEIEHLTAPHLWADTPCSKKLFCDVMVKQSDENVVLMEKKMDVLLSIVHPEVLSSVSHHLEDVMEAVKSGDCSRFACRRRILQ